MRSRHGFTYAAELIPLPEGPWPVTRKEATAPALRAIDTTLPGAHALLDQGHWTPEPDARDHSASTVGLLPFIVRRRIDGCGKMHTTLTKLPGGVRRG